MCTKYYVAIALLMNKHFKKHRLLFLVCFKERSIDINTEALHGSTLPSRGRCGYKLQRHGWVRF